MFPSKAGVIWESDAHLHSQHWGPSVLSQCRPCAHCHKFCGFICVPVLSGRQCFLDVLRPLCFRSLSASSPQGSQALKGGIWWASRLGTNVSVSLCPLSSCESLCLFFLRQEEAFSMTAEQGTDHVWYWKFHDSLRITVVSEELLEMPSLSPGYNIENLWAQNLSQVGKEMSGIEISLKTEGAGGKMGALNLGRRWCAVLVISRNSLHSLG